MKTIIRGRIYDTENAFLVHGVHESVGSDYREENIYMNYDGEFFMEFLRIRNFEDRSRLSYESRLKPMSKKSALRKLRSFGYGGSNLGSLNRLFV